MQRASRSRRPNRPNIHVEPDIAQRQCVDLRRVLQPVDSGISKRVCRHVSQEVCPWNEKFSLALREPAFEAREFLAGKDAATLAREILAMDDEDFRMTFKGSPMKRAKLRGLKRNAAVVLGNVGNPEDVDMLACALDDPEPLVRKHAAWALKRIVG